MHGLVNRSIQCFLSDTYGAEVWTDVADGAALGFDRFEALLSYDDALTSRVLLSAADRLEKSVEVLLEDLGTYLVSNAGSDGLRRLLRFGGVSFVDFLHSLSELEDRVRLAMPDLAMPVLSIDDHANGHFTLNCQFEHAGFGPVIVGMLRAMADDYGALVVLHHQETDTGCDEIRIDLLDAGFSNGRSFALGVPAA